MLLSRPGWIVCSLCLGGCVMGPLPTDADAQGDSSADAFIVNDALPLESAVDVMQSEPDVQSTEAGTDVPLFETSVNCGPVTATPSLMLFELRNAAFVGTTTPDVAVHVPTGFTTCRPMGAIVFVHGFNNCVRNVMGDTDTACVTGAGARGSLSLISQTDAARVNALLIAVEVRVDAATSDAGQLALTGGAYRLLQETLTEKLSPMLGQTLALESLDRIVLSTHSGGYLPVADMIEYGMLPRVREVDLLDSYYGNGPTWSAFLMTQPTRFDPTRTDSLRFVDVYTAGGGTAANSRMLAMLDQLWMNSAGMAAQFLWDDTGATLTTSDFAHAVIFKYSTLSHGDVPRYYVQKLAGSSGFASLP